MDSSKKVKYSRFIFINSIIAIISLLTSPFSTMKPSGSESSRYLFFITGGLPIFASIYVFLSINFFFLQMLIAFDEFTGKLRISSQSVRYYELIAIFSFLFMLLSGFDIIVSFFYIEFWFQFGFYCSFIMSITNLWLITYKFRTPKN